jgi:hypothetical protein
LSPPICLSQAKDERAAGMLPLQSAKRESRSFIADGFPFFPISALAANVKGHSIASSQTSISI